MRYATVSCWDQVMKRFCSIDVLVGSSCSCDLLVKLAWRKDDDGKEEFKAHHPSSTMPACHMLHVSIFSVNNDLDITATSRATRSLRELFMWFPYLVCDDVRHLRHHWQKRNDVNGLHGETRLYQRRRQFFAIPSTRTTSNCAHGVDTKKLTGRSTPLCTTNINNGFRGEFLIEGGKDNR